MKSKLKRNIVVKHVPETGAKNETYHNWLSIINPVIAIVIAFIFAGLVVLLSGDNPVTTYAVMIRGAFGQLSGIQNTLRFAAPILLLAMSFSICSTSGYFNIGQEGQMYASAVTLAITSTLLSGMPSVVRYVIMFSASCLAAALAALVPALLKSILGINEIVVGVMFNYLLSLFSTWVLTYSFAAHPSSSTPMSLRIPESMSFGLYLSAVLVILIVYFVFTKCTVGGYQLRMIGKNREFALASGINSGKILYASAFIGGLLAGFTAFCEIIGFYHIVYDGFASGMGFFGMTAALLGRHHPVGILLSAILLGGLQSGAVLLPVRTSVPAEIVEVVQGFVMFFATITLLQSSAFKKRGAK
ncbi:MAG TPA: ABC transporter permease [Clostridiaceae bacterium]|nr:ABC transporter permease [Clostridiaceae bacterium]